MYMGISLSPSDNFICRDWKEVCGIATPSDKEHLLAVIPWWSGDNVESSQGLGFSVFHGPRYIRSESRDPPRSIVSSVLFNVDTGRIVESTSASVIMCCFPHLQLLPSDTHISYKQMNASVQIIRLVTLFGDESKFSHLTGLRYEVIKRHDSVNDDQGGWALFISIINTQTSHCDNYLFLGLSEDNCDLVQYAQGFFIVDQALGSMLKVEPGTAGSNPWMTLDDHVNIHGFTVMDDGSRLLGWTVATDMILL
ncbi:hypothetical protein ARMGADRAFT_350771 [Armillaria gallica]|uniref:Uncharacterized protein n=1 Tax=Armillaria gallica TaxID=47427 RepID=A0A2H3DLF6_ARMGA|nr:hypothetical protein ARMGADRAFT_350771 [Armillaria gallica]